MVRVLSVPKRDRRRYEARPARRAEFPWMGLLMRPNTSVAAAALLLLASFAVRPAAQAPPQAPPAGQAPPAPNAPPGGAQAPVPAQGGRGRGNPATFPAQQRPPGDPALIARGQT